MAIDGVRHLGFEVRRDVDRGVGHDQQMLKARHVHHEGMA
jgi:hypothetical protein